MMTSAPDPMPTIIEVLHSYRERDRVAYRYLCTGEIDGPIEELSYRELWARVSAGATLLREHAGAGARVLLVYPPGLDFIVAFLSCLAAGLVAVPAYPPDPGRLARTLPRLRAIAHDCEPELVLSTAMIHGALAGLLPGKALLIDDARDLAPLPLGGAGASDLAMLQYTSGSTGLTKGVEVTHRALSTNGRMIATNFGLSAESHVLSWLPLYHDLGLIGFALAPIYVGSSCTVMSPIHFLQRPLRWLRALSHYRIAMSGGPNFGYELCARKVREEDLAGLRLDAWTRAFNAAEPVRASTLQRFARTFAPCGFREEAFVPCYGLAEATLVVSGAKRWEPPRVLRAEPAALDEGRLVPSPAGRSLVSCGAPALDTEIVIADPQTRRRCPADSVGEIWVRGRGIAAGYFRQPEATRETFGAYLDEGGGGPFLRTGDLGFLHEGELYITGRIKDLIVINGRNLYPQDVESTVEGAHESVRPGCCAAFSIERDDAERLVVLAEVAARAEAGAQDIAEQVRQAVFRGHQTPIFDLVLLSQGSIEKTTSGKIARAVCRRSYLDGGLTRVGA